MKNNTKLYLIPSGLGADDNLSVLPTQTTDLIKELQIFVVENIRTARRFLKSIDKGIHIDSLFLLELNEHTNKKELDEIWNKIKDHNVGIISEAGCPAVADPGSDLVAIAHKNNKEVVPLIGPSSILLALMGSGMNGQGFAFCGYLPVKTPARINAIKKLEIVSTQTKQTQIFIETPYRNVALFQDILKSCRANTLLCVACDLTSHAQKIKTRSIKEWQREELDIHKRPTVFLLHAY
ncbi:MAG: SAM-dependent methyltransferase [Bacteroidales bacterium]